MEYRVQQKFFSLSNSYGIFEESTNEELGMVHGKIFRFIPNFEYRLKATGETMFYIRGNWFRTFFRLLDKQGNVLAEVRSPFLQWFKKKIFISSQGQELYCEGNFWTLNFKIFDQSDQLLLEIKKRFFQIRDTFWVTVYGSLDYRIAIGLAIIVDAKFHPK